MITPEKETSEEIAENISNNDTIGDQIGDIKFDHIDDALIAMEEMEWRQALTLYSRFSEITEKSLCILRPKILGAFPTKEHITQSIANQIVVKRLILNGFPKSQRITVLLFEQFKGKHLKGNTRVQKIREDAKAINIKLKNRYETFLTQVYGNKITDTETDNFCMEELNSLIKEIEDQTPTKKSGEKKVDKKTEIQKEIKKSTLIVEEEKSEEDFEDDEDDEPDYQEEKEIEKVAVSIEQLNKVLCERLKETFPDFENHSELEDVLKQIPELKASVGPHSSLVKEVYKDYLTKLKMNCEEKVKRIRKVANQQQQQVYRIKNKIDKIEKDEGDIDVNFITECSVAFSICCNCELK